VENLYIYKIKNKKNILDTHTNHIFLIFNFITSKTLTNLSKKLARLVKLTLVEGGGKKINPKASQVFWWRKKQNLLGKKKEKK